MELLKSNQYKREKLTEFIFTLRDRRALKRGPPGSI
jgi:hypothetical protein